MTATSTILISFSLPIADLSDRLDAIGSAIRKAGGEAIEFGPASNGKPKLTSGSICPSCNRGQLRIKESRPSRRAVFQRIRLRCKACGWRAEPFDVPRETITRRDK